MKKYSLMIAISLIIFGLMSCEEESISNFSENDSSNIIKGNDVPDYLTSVPPGLTWDDVTTHFIIQKYDSYNPFISAFSSTERSDAWPADDSHNSVDAGDIKLDTNLLDKESITHEGDVLYAYTLYSDIQLAHNYTWDVQGSTNFPNFNKSITSPTSDVSITSHNEGSNVSKSSDLTVTWGGTYETANEVRVLLSGSGYSYVAYVPDNGTFTIPSADLSGFALGDARLIVTRGRYKFEQLPSSSKYAFIAAVLTEALNVNIIN